MAPSVAGRLHKLMCLFKHWSLRTELLSDRALGVEESYSRLAVRGAVGVGAGAFAVEDVGCALCDILVVVRAGEQVWGRLDTGLVVEHTVVGMALVLATSEVGLVAMLSSFCMMMDMMGGMWLVLM